MQLSLRFTQTLLTSAALLSYCGSVTFASPNVRTVLHISVDGLRPDAITTLGASKLPNFYRFRAEGAFTDNARTDVEQTITLPNHTTQITGRYTGTDKGHAYESNGIPGTATTLHRVKGEYVSSIFDVVHDHGLSTALFASKPKFILYDQSYNDSSGASDLIDEDNGRDKIDVFSINLETSQLVQQFLASLRKEHINYALLHLRDPDSTGHQSNWDLRPESDYLSSIVEIDRQLGQIFAAIEADEYLRHNSAIILTSDHGGRLDTIRHQPADDPENYIIPFYVWGPEIARGAELYSLNSNSRLDPQDSQPSHAAEMQPIRNGDSANLALDLLGLEKVPGSTINSAQNLQISQ